MLNDIHLLNFKSFGEISLQLSPVTLLAGLNNTGKSSIIQSLRMLWKCARGEDPTLSGHGSLKNMKNINASRSDPIKISCSSKRIKIEMTVDFKDPDHPVLHRNKQSSLDLPLMSYVSADRWGPRVFLPMYTAVDDLTHVGENSEYVIDFLSRHERDILPPILRHPKAEGDTLEYNVRAWLGEVSPNMNFKHGVEPQRDTSYATFDGFRPTNTGFGLSYTLPVIVSLLGMAAKWENEKKEKVKSLKGTLVLLENPEAHIHPTGQTSIGELIARTAASGVQVIVETHSDHLMDGIRIAIKSGEISPEMVSFYYFKLDQNGITSVEFPKIHSDGKLDYWPDGFFDQTMKNRAILARKG